MCEHIRQYLYDVVEEQQCKHDQRKLVEERKRMQSVPPSPETPQECTDQLLDAFNATADRIEREHILARLRASCVQLKLEMMECLYLQITPHFI